MNLPCSKRLLADYLFIYILSLCSWTSCQSWNATYLSQPCTVRTLRLHVNQILVEVLELFHGGPEGHNLAGGVRRGEHLCSRHPATSPDVTWEENKNINIFHNWYLIVKVTENRSDKTVLIMLLLCGGR